MSGSSTKLGVSLFLLIAWVTPAAIAGMLGWSAIWGNGNAFVDYLFPLPLIGGILHIPSFVVLALLVVVANNSTRLLKGLPAIALAICFIAWALQLDFDRINDWLFTDLQSVRPIKFGRNPLLLFVASDAAFLWLWLQLKSAPTPRILWFAPILAPFLIIAKHALAYSLAPAHFETVAPSNTSVRGQEIQLVYTDSGYDEAAFRTWFDSRPFARPWLSPNAQHKAVYFVASRRKVAYRDFTNLDDLGTVGTFCMYEEDKSIIAHAGFADCFAGHPTLTDRLDAALARQPRNINVNFARWHARLEVCRGLSLLKERADNIEHVDHCLRMRRAFPQDLLRTKKEYGRTSREARLAAATGQQLGFASK